MPGVFSKTNPPQRPGAYFNFVAAPSEGIPQAQGVVVAIGFIHDWGPYKTAVESRNFSEWQAIFGTSTNTPGYKAVRQLFQGEGAGGRGGAGTVISYRYGGSTAAKATLNVANTAGSPVANALALSARYEGDYGESLRITTQDYAADTALDELIIYLGTVEVERYQYANTNVNSLRDQINADSSWVSAVANATGTALAYVTTQALTGGDNGAAPSAADFSALLAGLDPQRFGAFVIDDISATAWSGGASASSILTAWKTWAADPVTGLNSKGKRFMSVVGGALNETVSTANTRSDSLNDPNFINLGVGSVTDDTLGALSTSQLAARAAGIYANRADLKSMTFARLGGVTLVNGPTESQVVTAFDHGTMVLSRDNATPPVRIERGLTTYTTTSDTNRPVTIYRSPKYVRTMHSIEMEFTEWAEQNIIGQVAVNDTTRTQVIGELQARLRAREDAGILQPGSIAVIDPDPPVTDQDEFIAIRYGIKFGRSVEQLWNTVVIG